MSTMTYTEMEAFLARPLVADFVTLRPGGAPHVAPVWHEFADGKFYVYTSRAFQRVRNIERDDRVALSIASHDMPYAYVVAEGRAVVTRDRVGEVGRSITTRYIGADNLDRVEEFLRQTLDDDSVLIELVPTRLMTWVADD